MAPRIGLVHAFQAAILPTEAAFAEVWPEVETISLYDGSLYADYTAHRELTPKIQRRVAALLRHSAETGAAAILFTGSFFAAPVEVARRKMAIPVLTANEAMIEEAFSIGSRLGLLATAADTVAMMKAEIARFATAGAKPYTLNARHVDGAMQALLSGDTARHDAMIAAAASEIGACDALMLGQVSMSSAIARMKTHPGRRILTGPAAAAAKLRGIVGMPDAGELS